MSATKVKDYTKQKAQTPKNVNKNAHINAFQRSSLYIMKDKITSFKSKKKATYSNGKNEKKMNLKIIETDQTLIS